MLDVGVMVRYDFQGEILAAMITRVNPDGGVELTVFPVGSSPFWATLLVSELAAFGR